MTDQRRGAAHEGDQELLDLTPAAYLVTDSNGTVRQANRRASRLLGSTVRFLTGKSLSSFVDAEHRTAFRERLVRADQLEAAPWVLRVRPRGGEPVTVVVAVTAARDPAGRPVALHWLLFEPPPGVRDRELAPPRGDGNDAPGATPDPDPAVRPQLDRLGHTLEEVVLAAVSLLRADHVGVMALDEGGEHRWLIVAGEVGETFERIRGELAAGPCMEAMRRRRPVWTSDLATDQRWPRLVEAVGARRDVRGAVAAPVLVEGRGAGACLALSIFARVWSEAELAATRAFAAVIAQALASSSR